MIFENLYKTTQKYSTKLFAYAFQLPITTNDFSLPFLFVCHSQNLPIPILPNLQTIPTNWKGDGDLMPFNTDDIGLC